MRACDNCGREDNQITEIGQICLCKRCAKKIKVDEWKNALFVTKKDILDTQSKIQNLLSKYNFTRAIKDEIDIYFMQHDIQSLIDSFETKEQILIVYTDKVILESIHSFNSAQYDNQFFEIKHEKIEKNDKITDDLYGTPLRAAVNIATYGTWFVVRRLAKALEPDTKETIVRPETWITEPGQIEIKYKDITNTKFILPNEVHCGVIQIFSEKRSPVSFYFKKKETDRAKAIYDLLVDSLEEINYIEEQSIKEKEFENQRLTYADLYLDKEKEKAEAIAAYKKLLDDGVITQDEFEQKKKQLLGV